MKMFVIDNAGKISAVQAESVTEGQTTFTTDNELAAVTSEWPSGKLVEIWNQLPEVARFASLRTASLLLRGSGRPFRALEPAVAPAARRPTEGRDGQEGQTRRGRAQSEQNHNGAGPLRREGGATLDAIMSATGWQAHSVRGFISGVLVKRMGVTVESAKREDGKRTYSLAS